MQNLQTRRTILAFCGMAAALVSPLALAHVGVDGAPHIHDGNALQSLFDGALHPLTGLDHLAAMVSVGAWAGLRHGSQATDAGTHTKSAWRIPATFAASLLAGAMMGLAGLQLPGVEPMIAVSLLIMGLLIASRMQLGNGIAFGLVALFALFHGLAHGAELGGHAFVALTGMLLSTLALHGLGMGLASVLGRQSSDLHRWATRLAGFGVAFMGASLLTPAVAAALH